MAQYILYLDQWDLVEIGYLFTVFNDVNQDNATVLYGQGFKSRQENMRDGTQWMDYRAGHRAAVLK